MGMWVFRSPNQRTIFLWKFYSFKLCHYQDIHKIYKLIICYQV